MREVSPLPTMVEFYTNRPEKITKREARAMNVLKNVGKVIVAGIVAFLVHEGLTNGISFADVAGGLMTGYVGVLAAEFGSDRERAVKSLLPK